MTAAALVGHQSAVYKVFAGDHCSVWSHQCQFWLFLPAFLPHGQIGQLRFMPILRPLRVSEEIFEYVPRYVDNHLEALYRAVQMARLTDYARAGRLGSYELVDKG